MKLSDFAENVSLAPFTTIGIGGPARYLAKISNSDDLTSAIKVCLSEKIPFCVLGNGSNTLISDLGFDGLVIINNTASHFDEVKISPKAAKVSAGIPRLEQLHPEEFYTAADLEYQEKAPSVYFRLDSGLDLPRAVNLSLAKDLTGLEWFAGIPGTIGGAVFMNVHGGRRFFGDLLVQATLIDKSGQIKEVDQPYFKFDYDYSVLHNTGEIVLAVVLELKKGNTQKAKATAMEWERRKSLQPRNSLGSTFQNLTIEDKIKYNLPSTSAGFIIDKLLGLRGNLSVGDAIVSPRSANFIENWGHAASSDVYTLIQEIKSQAKSKLGIDLKEEIQYLGKFS